MHESTRSVPRPATSFGQRILGAALLNVAIYEEVEHDPRATAQAAGVVGLVAVAAAAAGLHGGIEGLLAGMLGAYLGWGLWSGTCYLVGTGVFQGTATWGELLRTVGFAQAPGMALVLAALPTVGTALHIAVYLWVVATVFVAIRQALDMATPRALATALAGFVPYVLGKALLELLLGITPTFLP